MKFNIVEISEESNNDNKVKNNQNTAQTQQINISQLQSENINQNIQEQATQQISPVTQDNQSIIDNHNSVSNSDLNIKQSTFNNAPQNMFNDIPLQAESQYNPNPTSINSNLKENYSQPISTNQFSTPLPNNNADATAVMTPIQDNTSFSDTAAHSYINDNDNNEYEDEEKSNKPRTSKGKLIIIIVGLSIAILILLGVSGFLVYQTFIGDTKDYEANITTTAQTTANEINELSKINSNDLSSVKAVIQQASTNIDNLYNKLENIEPPDKYTEFHAEYTELVGQLNDEYKKLSDTLNKDSLSATDISNANKIIKDIQSTVTEYQKVLDKYKELKAE